MLLFVVCCALIVVWCVLFVVCCLLIVDCRLSCVITIIISSSSISSSIRPSQLSLVVISRCVYGGVIVCLGVFMLV